jgi:hypothetical protein
MKTYKVLNKVDFYETMKLWWMDWGFPVVKICEQSLRASIPET